MIFCITTALTLNYSYANVLIPNGSLEGSLHIYIKACWAHSESGKQHPVVVVSQ